MPEGDTIAYAARRLRPVLEGRVPEEIRTPRAPRWPSRLAGRVVESVDTHGKHLFVHFEGGLVLHSHLGMTGSWWVRGREPRAPHARVVMRAAERWVAQVAGPTLELLTEARLRFDQRLCQLGPDVLGAEFDFDALLRRLRADEATRPLGDALLDQRNLAGIGNIWKSEGCWEAAIDPWRPLGQLRDTEVLSVVRGVRPRMLESAARGPRTIEPRVYRRAGQPCPRCGTPIRSRGQGDANRTTYWCPGCQT